ncbi:MAG TPA: MarR family transcriptional regulator [Mycobacteriales bacterium]|nr:MarR family transcriptional regulator [Mycobacteriales bacterium]
MPEILDPDELARELAPRLARLLALLRGDAAEAGTSRPQLSVLGALVRRGPCRITELAVLEQVAQPTMTALVSRMERGDLLRREPDPTDRRAVRVTITAAGKAVYAAGIRHYGESLAMRMRKIGGQEWAALAAAVPALDLLINDSIDDEERSE